MAGGGDEGKLEWSSMDDLYSIRRIHEEVGLPVLVHVLEGIYSAIDSCTFSGGDYLKLHGCETVDKVVAYPTKEENGTFTKYYRNWLTPLEIPLDYRVKATVIPKHGENRVYPEVRLLLEDFPRYIRVGMPIEGKGMLGTSVPIASGSVLELLKTTTTSGKSKSLVCLLDGKEVCLRMNCRGRFTIVPDKELYTIREIVSRFPLPQLIELEENGSEVTKYLSGEANKALSNLENFKGTFVLDSTISEEVVYGTHRLEFHRSVNTKQLNMSLQAIVVIPLDSEATFQVALNRESSIYTSVFTQYYMETLKTKSLAPVCISLQGIKERTICLPEDCEKFLSVDDILKIERSPGDGKVKAGDAKVPGPKPAPRVPTKPSIPIKPTPAAKQRREVPVLPSKKQDTSTEMDDSDSDSSTEYEPVTPDMTTVFAHQTTPTTGGTLDRRRRPSAYEIVKLDEPVPERPERPERPEHSVKLPVKTPKHKTGQKIATTLSRAKDVIKDVPVAVRKFASKAFQASPNQKSRDKNSFISYQNPSSSDPGSSVSDPGSPASGPISPTSGPSSPASSPNSPTSSPISPASGSKTLPSGKKLPHFPVLQKVASDDEEIDDSASDSSDIYDYPDPSKEDLRFPTAVDTLPKNNTTQQAEKEDKKPTIPKPQSPDKSTKNPTYKNLQVYPKSPNKGNSLDRQEAPKNVVEVEDIPTVPNLALPSMANQPVPKVVPVQPVKPQPSTRVSPAKTVKPETITESTTQPAKKPVAPLTAPKPVRPNLKSIGPKFSYSRGEIMEMSVTDVYETMKKIVLAEKADRFKESRVDGSFLMTEMTDTALAGFNLTEVETLHVKRFIKDGRIPKMK